MQPQDINGMMQDALGGAIQSSKDYSAAIDRYAGHTGTDTSGMQRTMAEGKKLAAQIPSSVPAAPELNKGIPDAPKAPDLDPLDTFKQFAPALAIFGSLATRHPLKSAMLAAGAAMDAYGQKNQQLFENKQKEWAQETEKITKQNQTELEAFHAALESSHGNMDLLQAKLTANAAQFQDEHVMASLRAGDIDRALDIYAKKEDANNKLLDALGKYQKMTVGSNLSDGTLDFVADQVLAGDKSALTNFGRGQQGAQNLTAIRERVAEKAHDRGLNGSDLAKIDAQFSGLQTAARNQAKTEQQITLASNILDKSLPSLMSAAQKLDLSPSTDINAVYNAARQRLSSRDFANFATQLRAVTTDYSALISRGKGATVHSDEEALKILKDDMGIGSLQGFTDAVSAERANIKEGMQATDTELFGNKNAPTPAEKIVKWEDLK